jgi:hypothetical protein
VRRAGPRAGEGAEPFAERLARVDARADAVLSVLEDAQNRYLVRTADAAGDPLVRARAAVELGLPQTAIEGLSTSHYDLYGPPGLGLLADLLLQTGQVEECRVVLDRAELRRNPNVLGFFELPRRPNPDGSNWPYQLHVYDWLDLCQCAVAGRYVSAQGAIDRLCERAAADGAARSPVLAAAVAEVVVHDVGLGVPPNPVLARMLNLHRRLRAERLLSQARGYAVTRADFLTVGGVLDLERGEVGGAAARFASARPVYAAAPAGLARPGEALAARYHEALRARK